MKKKGLWIGGAVAVVVGGLAVWGPRRGAAPEEDIRRGTVERGTIEITVEATGDVAPLNRVEVLPPVAGRVERLLVDEGDRVRRGQILGWISSTDRTAILDAARAQGPEVLAQWEDTYKPTPLVSPLSGTVIARKVVVGQTVNTGTVLFALSDELIVVARVDEVDIGRLSLGLPARLVLDAYPRAPVEGAVVQILREGKNVSNVITYDVKVRPHHVPDTFRSEMTANVSFLIDRRENTLWVPPGAVTESPDGKKTVRVSGPKGAPEERPVTTGLETPDRMEILSGLEEGQEVWWPSARYVPQTGAPTSPLVSTGPPRARSGGGRSRGAH